MSTFTPGTKVTYTNRRGTQIDAVVVSWPAHRDVVEGKVQIWVPSPGSHPDPNHRDAFGTETDAKTDVLVLR